MAVAELPDDLIEAAIEAWFDIEVSSEFDSRMRAAVAVVEQAVAARVRAEAVADERQRIAALIREHAGAENGEGICAGVQRWPAERARGYTAAINEVIEEVLDEAAGSVPVATPAEEWRTTTGRPLGREPRSRRPITRHGCGCVTGWDDVYEECVLRRCSDHGPVATPTEPEPLCEECCDGKHQRCPEQPGCCCARRLDAASPVPAVQRPMCGHGRTGKHVYGSPEEDDYGLCPGPAEQPEER